MGILLVSRDSSLIERVTRIVSQLDRLRLFRADSLESLERSLETKPISLIALHATEETDSDLMWQSVCRHVKKHPGCSNLVIGESRQPQQALHYIQEGAADYLTRPVDLRRLAYLLDVFTVKARYVNCHDTQSETSFGVESVSDENPFLYTAGEMQTTVAALKKLAPLDTTILLTGETGTGKSRLGRLIHELSPRRELPCVVVDCGAVSWQLLESEMFGHVKGAFTGADSDKSGKFAAAGKGTLIIEEINVLPMQLQTKFLRALEDRVYHPVGSTRELPLEARLIVATNRSLRDEITAGRFRADLYYRINVVSFCLPNLRERRKLIPALAAKFADDVSRQHGHQVPVVCESAMRTLQAYEWPGNIRELRNVMERCVTLASNQRIEVADLPEELRAGVGRLHPRPPLGLRRRDLSRLASKPSEIPSVLRLQQCGNNRSKAAVELGISRVTLYKKLRNWNDVRTHVVADQLDRSSYEQELSAWLSWPRVSECGLCEQLPFGERSIRQRGPDALRIRPLRIHSVERVIFTTNTRMTNTPAELRSVECMIGYYGPGNTCVCWRFRPVLRAILPTR